MHICLCRVLKWDRQFCDMGRVLQWGRDKRPCKSPGLQYVYSLCLHMTAGWKWSDGFSIGPNTHTVQERCIILPDVRPCPKTSRHKSNDTWDNVGFSYSPNETNLSRKQHSEYKKKPEPVFALQASFPGLFAPFTWVAIHIDIWHQIPFSS